MEVLKKLTPSKKYVKNGFDFSGDFFVFDTENYGGLEPKPSNFAMGVIYGKEYVKVLYTSDEVKEELKHPRYSRKTIFAHNAEYDIQVTWGNVFKDLDRSALYVGSKFICAYYDKKRKVRIADSFNLLQTGAAKIGEQLGYEKLPTPSKFLDGGKREPINDTDIEYCVRDCAIIFKALCLFFQKVGSMRITIASSAMYYFRSQFLESPIFYDREKSNNFFESYYGGRTEVFRLGECDLQVADINSLYPFRMREEMFPNPQYLKVEKRIEVKRLQFLMKHYGGCADITVDHKYHYFGHLPVKFDTGSSKKLLFPVGKFRTCVNFNELQYAIDSDVVEILEVHKVTYSTKWMDSPFSEYVDINYNERKNTDKPYINYILKLLLNSLYGKFAERIRQKITWFSKISNALKYIEYQINRKKFDIKLFNKTRQDCLLVENLDEEMQPEHSIPVFASYITSGARVQLLKELKATDDPYYCDTDSIFYSGKFGGQMSDEMGDWKLEDKRVKEIRGLKNYTYEQDGKLYESIKGVGKRAEKIGPAHYVEEKYRKSRSALRMGVMTGEKYIMEKKLSGIYDKRKILPGGLTEPLNFVDLINQKSKISNEKITEKSRNDGPNGAKYSPKGLPCEAKKSRICKFRTAYNSENWRRNQVIHHYCRLCRSKGASCRYSHGKNFNVRR